MTSNSVFPVLSIDREDIHWEDYLYSLTPVELREDLGKSMLFKRDDYFCPLGYGGINGSKLRQAVWLGHTYLTDEIKYVVGGMSNHSPQHPMQAAVARHYGKTDIDVCFSSTGIPDFKREPMLELANWIGCQFFVLTNSAYNNNFQMWANRVKKSLTPEAFRMEYGITLDLSHSAQEIEAFHRVGAEQVRNIPENVENLIITFGSANSATSVLYGLTLYPKKNLKRIYLIGVGPDKRQYLVDRLCKIMEYTHMETRMFKGLDYPKTVYSPLPKEFPYEVTYLTTWHKYTDYSKLLTGISFGGIDFHPRYEAKTFNFIKTARPDLIKNTTLFWIVGSDVSKEAMTPYVEGNEGDWTRYYDPELERTYRKS